MSVLKKIVLNNSGTFKISLKSEMMNFPRDAIKIDFPFLSETCPDIVIPPLPPSAQSPCFIFTYFYYKAEISETLGKVSVSTTFDQSRPVSVSTTFKFISLDNPDIS